MSGIRPVWGAYNCDPPKTRLTFCSVVPNHRLGTPQTRRVQLLPRFLTNLPFPAVGNSSPFLTQTCLFTIFPNISTTIRGSQFWENHEKAGLSKTGMSCRRLAFSRIHASQTKILVNETAGRACLFEALCEGSSPKSSTHTLAKCLEKTRPTRGFVYQNLRLRWTVRGFVAHIEFSIATSLEKTRSTCGSLFPNRRSGDIIVANKKSHFRPSDEESMKNVDKDAVNTKIGCICYFRHMNILRECAFTNVNAS